MSGWMSFMLIFEIDKHVARPRENNNSIIFSWLDEKLASSWRKCSYTAQQGMGFICNGQFSKHRILQLDTVSTFCVTNFSVCWAPRKKDQFHLYMIRRSVFVYLNFRSSLQLVSISALEVYYWSLSRFSFLTYSGWSSKALPPPPPPCFQFWTKSFG